MAFSSRNRTNFDTYQRPTGGGGGKQSIYAGGSLAGGAANGRQLQRPRSTLNDDYRGWRTEEAAPMSSVLKPRSRNTSNEFASAFRGVSLSQQQNGMVGDGSAGYRDRFGDQRDRQKFAGSGFVTGGASAVSSSAVGGGGMYQRSVVKSMNNRPSRFNHNNNENSIRRNGGGGIGTSKRGLMNRRVRNMDDTTNHNDNNFGNRRGIYNSNNNNDDDDRDDMIIRGNQRRRRHSAHQYTNDPNGREYFDSGEEEYDYDNDTAKKHRKSNGISSVMSMLFNLSTIAIAVQKWLDYTSLWFDSYVTTFISTVRLVCGYDSIDDMDKSRDSTNNKNNNNNNNNSRAYAMYNLLLFNLTPLCIGCILLLYGQYFTMVTASVCAVRLGCNTEFKTWIKGISSIFWQTWEEYHSTKISRIRRQRLNHFHLSTSPNNNDIVNNNNNNGAFDSGKENMPLFPPMNDDDNNSMNHRRYQSNLNVTVSLLGIFFSHVNQRAVYFPLVCFFHALSAVGCSLVFGRMCIPLVTAITITDLFYQCHVSSHLSLQWKKSFTENKRHFATMFLFIPMIVILFVVFSMVCLFFGLRVLAAIYTSMIGSHMITVYLINEPSMKLFVLISLVGCIAQWLMISPFASFVVSVCLFPFSALENALRFIS